MEKGELNQYIYIPVEVEGQVVGALFVFSRDRSRAAQVAGGASGSGTRFIVFLESQIRYTIEGVEGE